MVDKPDTAEYEPPQAQGQCLVTTRSVGDVVVVSVSGTLDALTSPNLTESLDTALSKSPPAVIVDLSQVDFLASAGMSALVDAHDKANGSRFGVVADGPATSRPMTLVGLDAIVSLYPTLDAALKEIGGAGT
jgi:anti-sigma B factor antagonist